MKRTIIIFLIVMSTIAFVVYINNSYAAEPGGKGIDGTGDIVSLDDPLKLPAKDPIPTLIGKVIKGALGVVGSLALVMFIYGGLVWMTAAGNEQRVKMGKDILIWATIGLIVIFTSYALVHFIIFKGLGLEK